MFFLNAKRYTLNASPGFTLIELLVALAIVAIVSVISVSSFSSVNSEEALSLEAGKIVSLLSKAQAFTISAKGGTAYGVHFEERKVVLFSGTTYSPASPENQIQILNRAVKISSVSLSGGGSEVVFQKLSGGTLQSGIVTLSLVNNVNASTTVTIGATGVAYIK